MDLYDLTLEKLLDLSFTQSWPELQALLQRIIMKKEHHWRIPLVACEAVGGSLEQAIPAVAALACLHTSILLIDDLLDADPRGEYHRLGPPATANLAAALQAVSLEVVAQSEAPLPARLAALQSMNLAALTIAGGQQLDTQNPTGEAAYWRVVEMKSAPFFGVAVQVGAVLGGASAEIAEQLRQWGNLYGEMIQIHDDLNDAMAVPPNPDWTLGRTSLPMLFAQSVDYPERSRFLELRCLLQSAPTPEALTEAQTILLRCGAVSYSIEELFSRHRTAQQMLESMTLPHRVGLALLLEDLIQPVERLFAAIATH
jgi:geranylgeranyl pyrophosphate synthase